jgi:hypothetical protein
LGKNRREFKPYYQINEPFNNKIIENLISFNEQVDKKGATVLLTFQGLQSVSFEKL